MISRGGLCVDMKWSLAFPCNKWLFNWVLLDLLDTLFSHNIYIISHWRSVVWPRRGQKILMNNCIYASPNGYNACTVLWSWSGETNAHLLIEYEASPPKKCPFAWHCSIINIKPSKSRLLANGHNQHCTGEISGGTEKVVEGNQHAISGKRLQLA